MDKKKKKTTISSVESLSLMAGKLPPQSDELEVSVLGALIVENEMIQRVKPIIASGDIFYKNAHRIIYDTILELSNEPNKVVDMLTVSEEIKRKGQLEEVGGIGYIASLTKDIAGARHVREHAKYVVEKYLLREVILISGEAMSMSYNNKDIDDIIEYIALELDRIQSITKTKNTANFKDTLNKTIDEIEDRIQNTESNTFFKTGYPLFDKRVSLDLNNVVILSGRNSSGKSQFVISLMRGILDNNEDVEILWFTMEDPKEKITRRFISMDTNLDDKELQSKKRKLNEDDAVKIANSVKKIANYNITFYDRKIDITRLKMYAINFANKSIENGKKPIVIVDNLGLINCKLFSVQRDDHIANELVEIKSETGALLIVIHHLSKETDNAINIKNGYRPVEKNIRGSARIIDYADISLLINKPSKYQDLLAMYKNRIIFVPPIVANGTIKDNGEFKKLFLSINPGKDVNNMNEDEFFVATKEAFNKAINAGLSMEDIYRKYKEYVNYAKSLNDEREAKFKSKIKSLYRFLNDGDYKKIFIDTESRDYYLFGNKEVDYNKLLSMFIVEISKLREEDLLPDEILLRYEANLHHCLFKEL